jgi:hypothetical protein
MVEDYGGNNNLYNYLKALKARPNFSQLTAIGLTRDADNSVSNTFESIKLSLRRVNLSIPNKLGEKTTEIPNINIYLLSDNQNEGMLENLCLESIKDDSTMFCVNQYFECLKTNSNSYPNNLAKAKIHSWLASREKPDTRLAEATEIGNMNFDNPVFEPLKKFILSL